jgi:hypothetical protein
MAVKKTQKKQPEATLGQVVMVYTKGSSHWWALVEPKVVEIEQTKFIEGTQVTGKEGHRMERKRTLIPFDHVASIIEFAAEEDLWSAPQRQPKNVPTFEEPKNPLLTSHEQPGANPEKHKHGNRRGRNRHRQKKGSSDARYQEQYDTMRNRNF